MPTVSIIGTAGRKGVDDAQRMYSGLLSLMVEKAAHIITNDLKLSWDNVDLVSGGAAWADHVAVLLYLNTNARSLRLCLPCEWDPTHNQFLDNGSRDWQQNPAHTANYYHQKFSSVIGHNSFMDIKRAIDKGAVLDCSQKGFHNRNTLVARSDFVIAFTWNDGSIPKDGGTKDTWDKCTSHKIHVPLSSLVPTTVNKPLRS